MGEASKETRVVVIELDTGDVLVLISLAGKEECQLVTIDSTTGALIFSSRPGIDVFDSIEKAERFATSIPFTTIKQITHARAIVGYLALGSHGLLLLVTNVKPSVPNFPGGGTVFTILESQWIKIPLKNPFQLTKAEATLVSDLQDFSLNKTHYYCETRDITRPFPSEHTVDDPDEEFVWNSFLSSSFSSLGLKHHCIVLLQGIAECRNFMAPGGKNLTLGLFARRSRLHPGTRYLARGLNAASGTGNEIECEQIVWENLWLNSRNSLQSQKFSTYLWRRGTIPIWWGAEIKSSVAEAEIHVLKDQPEGSAKYFQQLVHRYDHPSSETPGRASTPQSLENENVNFPVRFTDNGNDIDPFPIVCVNLLRVGPGKAELPLAESFQKAINKINSENSLSNTTLELITYDWHANIKEIGEERTIENLWRILKQPMQRMGLSLGEFLPQDEVRIQKIKSDQRLITNFGSYGGYFLMSDKQRGIARFNCADSLDRTNAASFFACVQVMVEQCWRLSSPIEANSEGSLSSRLSMHRVASGSYLDSPVSTMNPNSNSDWNANLSSMLPPGWEMRHDKQTNKIFYIDHNTKTTTWKHPVLNNALSSSSSTTTTTTTSTPSTKLPENTASKTFIHFNSESNLSAITGSSQSGSASKWSQFDLPVKRIRETIHPSPLSILSELFLLAGDIHANLYTGSKAMHSHIIQIFSEDSVKSKRGSTAANLSITLQRRYLNMVKDSTRQKQLECLLGLRRRKYFPSLPYKPLQVMTGSNAFILKSIPSLYSSIYPKGGLINNHFRNSVWVCPPAAQIVELFIFLKEPSHVTHLLLTIAHGCDDSTIPQTFDLRLGQHLDNLRLIQQETYIPRCAHGSQLLFPITSSPLTEEREEKPKEENIKPLPYHRSALYNYEQNEKISIDFLTRIVSITFYNPAPNMPMTLGLVEVLGISSVSEWRSNLNCSNQLLDAHLEELRFESTSTSASASTLTGFRVDSESRSESQIGTKSSSSSSEPSFSNTQISSHGFQINQADAFVNLMDMSVSPSPPNSNLGSNSYTNVELPVTNGFEVTSPDVSPPVNLMDFLSDNPYQSLDSKLNPPTPVNSNSILQSHESGGDKLSYQERDGSDFITNNSSTPKADFVDLLSNELNSNSNVNTNINLDVLYPRPNSSPVDNSLLKDFDNLPFEKLSEASKPDLFNYPVQSSLLDEVPSFTPSDPFNAFGEDKADDKIAEFERKNVENNHPLMSSEAEFSRIDGDKSHEKNFVKPHMNANGNNTFENEFEVNNPVESKEDESSNSVAEYSSLVDQLLLDTKIDRFTFHDLMRLEGWRLLLHISSPSRNETITSLRKQPSTLNPDSFLSPFQLKLILPSISFLASHSHAMTEDVEISNFGFGKTKLNKDAFRINRFRSLFTAGVWSDLEELFFGKPIKISNSIQSVPFSYILRRYLGSDSYEEKLHDFFNCLQFFVGDKKCIGQNCLGNQCARPKKRVFSFENISSFQKWEQVISKFERSLGLKLVRPCIKCGRPICTSCTVDSWCALIVTRGNSPSHPTFLPYSTYSSENSSVSQHSYFNDHQNAGRNYIYEPSSSESGTRFEPSVTSASDNPLTICSDCCPDHVFDAVISARVNQVLNLQRENRVLRSFLSSLLLFQACGIDSPIAEIPLDEIRKSETRNSNRVLLSDYPYSDFLFSVPTEEGYAPAQTLLYASNKTFKTSWQAPQSYENIEFALVLSTHAIASEVQFVFSKEDYIYEPAPQVKIFASSSISQRERTFIGEWNVSKLISESVRQDEPPPNDLNGSESSPSFFRTITLTFSHSVSCRILWIELSSSFSPSKDRGAIRLTRLKVFGERFPEESKSFSKENTPDRFERYESVPDSRTAQKSELKSLLDYPPTISRQKVILESERVNNGGLQLEQYLSSFSREISGFRFDYFYCPKYSFPNLMIPSNEHQPLKEWMEKKVPDAVLAEPSLLFLRVWCSNDISGSLNLVSTYLLPTTKPNTSLYFDFDEPITARKFVYEVVGDITGCVVDESAEGMDYMDRDLPNPFSLANRIRPYLSLPSSTLGTWSQLTTV